MLRRDRLAGLAVLGSALTGANRLLMSGVPAEAADAAGRLSVSATGPACLVTVTDSRRPGALEDALTRALGSPDATDTACVWLLAPASPVASVRLDGLARSHGFEVAASFGVHGGLAHPTHLVPVGDRVAVRWFVRDVLRPWGLRQRVGAAVTQRFPRVDVALPHRAHLLVRTGTAVTWPAGARRHPVIHLGGGATAGRVVLSVFDGPGAAPDRHVKLDPAGSASAVSSGHDLATLEQLADTTIAATVPRVLGRGAAGLAVFAGVSHLPGHSVDLRWSQSTETWERDVETVVAWIVKLAGAMPEPLVHGDLWPGNIVIDDGRVGVLDWENAHAGDPLCNLVFFLATSIWSRYDVDVSGALPMLFTVRGRHRDLGVRTVRHIVGPDATDAAVRDRLVAAMHTVAAEAGPGGVADGSRRRAWLPAIARLITAWDEDGSPWAATKPVLNSPAVDSGRLRVLHVLDSFSFGGAENLVVELARTPQDRFTLAAASITPTGTGRDAMYGRLEQAGLTPRHLGVRRLVDPVGFLRLTRSLRACDADVVHAHLGYAATLVPLAARLAGKPVVATLHHHPADLPRGEALKERLSVRIPAALGRLVLVSQPAFDEFARRHGPATSTWRMIPNGIDLSRFTRPVPPPDRAAVLGSGPPSSVPLPDDAVVWSCVAALREPKGHEDLLAAWQAVVREHPHAHLVIVGDGPHRGAIEAAVERLGLTDHVHLLGRREDVPQILAVSDGVVSASHTEALPTALIEGAAARLPVVSTAAGGTTDIVEDGRTGRVVPVRDVDALAAALVEVIGDPERGRAMGAAGRNAVEAVFSMSAWISALDALYREVGADTRSHTVTARDRRRRWAASAKAHRTHPSSTDNGTRTAPRHEGATHQGEHSS